MLQAYGHLRSLDMSLHLIQSVRHSPSASRLAQKISVSNPERPLEGEAILEAGAYRNASFCLWVVVFEYAIEERRSTLNKPCQERKHHLREPNKYAEKNYCGAV